MVQGLGPEIARLGQAQIGLKPYALGVLLALLAAGAHLAVTPAPFWTAQPSGAPWVGGLFELVGLGVVLMLVHELLHGVMLALAGDREARFGMTRAGLCVFPSGKPLTRKAYLAVLLAPLVVLFPLTVLASGWLFGTSTWLNVVLAGTAHVAGCCMDVYAAGWVLKLPSQAVIVNRYPEPMKAFDRVDRLD